MIYRMKQYRITEYIEYWLYRILNTDSDRTAAKKKETIMIIDAILNFPWLARENDDT